MNLIGELEIYQAGQLTVIGFGGREYLDQLDLSNCYDEIIELIRENDCRSLAVDLTGVKWIPSGLLGVLMSVHRLTGDVHVYNPSKDIREVLEVTRLNRVLHLHEIDV
jgi:anti-anti-sigma factor